MHTLLLYFRCRKESSFNLGSAETKLLYTLHWILLDAADECALAMGNEGKLDSTPFAYLFPITSITVRTETQNEFYFPRKTLVPTQGSFITYANEVLHF